MNASANPKQQAQKEPKAMIEATQKNPPKKLGRHKTRDAANPYAFNYRMPAGFAGDVSRFHGSKIEPCLIDPNSTILMPGVPVVVNPATNSVRAVTAADAGAVRIYGIVVRVYPEQQTTGGMTALIGNSAVQGPIANVLRTGYIMVPIVGQPTKDGQVHVWVAASNGVHLQGGFESAASAGNTIDLPLTGASFNGPPDGNGIGELMFNI